MMTMRMIQLHRYIRCWTGVKGLQGFGVLRREADSAGILLDVMQSLY